ncbi:MAG: hypothetical protein GFH27_549323n39 [Chloroflexi bacterium AL-W]|nr:hypothetical protein [Chloroflexi bacterium AL-N1]NOK70190.1 hypothetical protein [Chloroflexi bacterium AL-N10]NOK77727.1 hypothetical protein [Chloroflexi bacterium AL-N5]NOK84736.1 hypothetical protein [Chloroflexi bacterium AL-W]NOK93201.1 hypothetical protein [Chloroflexi bacterium AL-N15]
MVQRVNGLYVNFVLLLSLILLTSCGTTPVAQQPADDPTGSAVPETPTAPVEGEATVEAPAEDDLVYYWPATLPSGLTVNPNRVSVSEQSYAIDTTIAVGRVLTISGGRAPVMPGFPVSPQASETDTTVRGQSGTLISEGSWSAIVWEEATWGYTIYGLNTSQEELLAIAEALEPLQQSVWEERLEAFVPTDQSASELGYFWPDYLPDGFEINLRNIEISSDSFSVSATTSDRSVTITGGASTRDPALSIEPASVIDVTTVRGQPGLLVGSGLQHTLIWDEQGHRYSISGNIPQDELLAVVEGMVAVPSADWEARMARLSEPTMAPTADLAYLWPSQLPEGWSVQPDESQADEYAFTLTMADPTDPQMFVTLQGGIDAPTVEDLPAPPQETLEIRGNEAFFFTTGGGGKYRWRENGNPYALDGYITSEMLALLDESLETLDLATWQERLASIE